MSMSQDPRSAGLARRSARRGAWASFVLGLAFAPVSAAQLDGTPALRDVAPGKAGATCFTPELVLYQHMSGLQDRTLEIVNDEAAWCALWDRIHEWIWPEPPCDTTLIDFETTSAIAVGLGARPNLCYGFSVPLVCEGPGAGQIDMTVVESHPGPGCLCGQAIVQPLAVFAVERPVRRVTLKHGVQVFDCEQPPEDL
jgi:hypothetical protein